MDSQAIDGKTRINVLGHAGSSAVQLPHVAFEGEWKIERGGRPHAGNSMRGRGQLARV